MHPSDLEELLKLLAAAVFICLVELLRRKLLETGIAAVNGECDRGIGRSFTPKVDENSQKVNLNNESSEAAEKYTADVNDSEPESTAACDKPVHSESDHFEKPLTEGDCISRYPSRLVFPDNNGVAEDAATVRERHCLNLNKATPFDTEEKSEDNISPLRSSPGLISPRNRDERRSSSTAVLHSSPQRVVDSGRGDDASAGRSEVEQNRNEVRWMDNSSRSGSNAFQIRGSPPSYEDVATAFYGAGPIFHSWEKLTPDGGTISIAGCGILIPRDALTEEQQIDVMCCYPEFPLKNDEWMAITPHVFMGPPGFHFRKQLALSLPTYFEPSQPTHLFRVKIEKRGADGQWEQIKIAKYSFGKKIVLNVNHSGGFRALAAVGRHLDDRLIKTLYFVGFIKRFTLRNSPDEHFVILRVCNNMAHNIKFIEAEMQADDYEVVIQPQTVAIRKNQNFVVELSSKSRNVQVEPSTSRFRIENDYLWAADTLHLRTFKIRRDRKEFQGWVDLQFTVTASLSHEDFVRNSQRVVEAHFHWMEAKPKLSRSSTEELLPICSNVETVGRDYSRSMMS